MAAWKPEVQVDLRLAVDPAPLWGGGGEEPSYVPGSLDQLLQKNACLPDTHWWVWIWQPFL
jgi:hypothetical protein